MRWTRAEAIADARLMVHYYQATRDGRIVFGKGGGTLAYRARIGAGFHHDARRTAWVTEHMHKILPATVGAEITHSWAGPVARTDDGLPDLRAPRRRVVHGGGYSGNGVGPSWVGGRILASLALGRDDEWANAGLVREPGRAFPPEPVRYLGGRVVREAVRQDGGGRGRGQEARPARHLRRRVRTRPATRAAAAASGASSPSRAGSARAPASRRASAPRRRCRPARPRRRRTAPR